MRSTYWRAEASDRPALMLVRASRTSSRGNRQALPGSPNGACVPQPSAGRGAS